MSDRETDYFGEEIEVAPAPRTVPSEPDAPPSRVVRAAPATPAPDPAPAPLRPAAPMRRWSPNAIAIAASLLLAIGFGLYAGLFVRAFGDPEVHGIWVSIGSVLFTLWVIAVTIWAVLRVSAWASAILLRTTARVSIVAYRILKTPIRIASILAFFGLAIYGAVVLLSRLSAG
ncbi:hypothetical protein [uncultured Jannaschia sp.]|uniref:hypothetical protein n=1 Tax=uncultured Jannaschia sp. TaxID=293347 RepID=UPI002629D6CA|nr:hypothetical protein [uncultured Jannaschia sp.]